MEESHQAKGKSQLPKRRLSLPLENGLAQSSLEYLLIVAITFTIIVPTAYLFYSYSKESSAELGDAQITKIGRAIVDTANSIFYSGQGSKTVLDVNIPDMVSGAVIIDGRELVFNMTTSFGISELVFFSPINLTTTGENCDKNVCSLADIGNPGLKKVKVEVVSTESVNIY